MVCFMKHVPKEKLQEILNEYPSHFEKDDAGDFQLLVEALQTLSKLSIDYTFFFRQLCRYKNGNKDSLKELFDYYGNRQDLIEWLDKYSARLELESISDDERSRNMKNNNPKYVLKNYIAQEVIEEVGNGGNEKLKAWLTVLDNPFDEQPAFEAYSKPTPSEHKNYEVSCSS